MFIEIKDMIINAKYVSYIEREYDISLKKYCIKIYSSNELLHIIGYYTYEECEKELEKIMKKMEYALNSKNNLCLLKIDNLIANTKDIKFIEKGSGTILGKPIPTLWESNNGRDYIIIHFVGGKNHTFYYTSETGQQIVFNKISEQLGCNNFDNLNEVENKKDNSHERMLKLINFYEETLKENNVPYKDKDVSCDCDNQYKITYYCRDLDGVSITFHMFIIEGDIVIGTTIYDEIYDYIYYELSSPEEIGCFISEKLEKIKQRRR